MLQMYLVGHASFHRVRIETVGMVYTGGEEGKEEDKEGEAKLEGLTREGRAGGDDIVGEGGEVDIREDKARTETKKVFRGKEVDQGMK
uniref:Uncharacterized protein n=1 Tax=Fagus sylvatica TaxID=28930 RepID=A0A2N9HAN3_FAGSY